jgi:hypothetical protein
MQLHEWKMSLEREDKILAQNKLKQLEDLRRVERAAIEANALPWVPKSELLEHRYENEALDKLENPSISWDTVPDIGRVS